MKILSLKRYQETDEFHFVKVTYRTFWGKELYEILFFKKDSKIGINSRVYSTGGYGFIFHVYINDMLEAFMSSGKDEQVLNK